LCFYSFRFKDEWDKVAVFAQNDEPSLINLGIPVDTEPSLMHPNIRDIFHQILRDFPPELREWRLYNLIKKKQEEENAKAVSKIKMWKYFIYKIKGVPPLKPEFPSIDESKIKLEYPIDVKMEWKRDTSLWVPKYKISLRAMWLKFSLKYWDTKLRDEITDFKNYLFSWKQKSLEGIIDDLLHYETNTVTTILNPLKMKQYLPDSEFNDIKTIRLFFIWKIRKFCPSSDSKTMNNIIDLLFQIMTLKTIKMWSVEDFAFLKNSFDLIKKKNYSAKNITNLLDLLKKELDKRSTPDEILKFLS
jgi:hypothetical protein